MKVQISRIFPTICSSNQTTNGFFAIFINLLSSLKIFRQINLPASLADNVLSVLSHHLQSFFFSWNRGLNYCYFKDGRLNLFEITTLQPNSVISDKMTSFPIVFSLHFFRKIDPQIYSFLAGPPESLRSRNSSLSVAWIVAFM